MIVGIQPRRGEATICEAGVDVHWLKSPRFSWLKMAMDERRNKFHSVKDQNKGGGPEAGYRPNGAADG